MVQYLINYDTNLETQNSDGDTALSLACRLGNISVIEILIDNSPTLLEIYNHDGLSPLAIAAKYGHTKVC